eukprot:SAG11_NODE_15655_length_570_cov_1.615711_1_plen_29_part_10
MTAAVVRQLDFWQVSAAAGNGAAASSCSC